MKAERKNSELTDAQLTHVNGGAGVNETAESAEEVIRNIGIQVAERIEATMEALNARQEVRLAIQNTLLKGSTVIISKIGKEHNVSFVTVNDQQVYFLSQHIGELRSRLMEALKDIDYVEVTF